MNDLKRILFLVLLQTIAISSTNIDCNGNAFHCVNSTHFLICIDLGGGVSITIDDFVIPCPQASVCEPNNYLECEYPKTTTVYPLGVIGITKQKESKIGVVTTTTPILSSVSPEYVTPMTTGIVTADSTTRSNVELIENATIDTGPFIKPAPEITTVNYNNVNGTFEANEITGYDKIKSTHESIFSQTTDFGIESTINRPDNDIVKDIINNTTMNKITNDTKTSYETIMNGIDFALNLFNLSSNSSLSIKQPKLIEKGPLGSVNTLKINDPKVGNELHQELIKNETYVLSWISDSTTSDNSTANKRVPFIEKYNFNVSSTSPASIPLKIDNKIQENKKNRSQITMKENPEKIAPLLDIITDSTYEPTTKTISPANTSEIAAFNSSSLLRNLNTRIHDINIDNNKTKVENYNNNINSYTESNIVTISNETTVNNTIKLVPQVTLNETRTPFNLNNAQSKTNTTTTMFSEIPSTTQYKKGNELIGTSETYITDNIAVSNKENIMSNKATFDEIPYNMTNINFINKELSQNDTNTHSRSYENSELKLSPFTSEVMINTTEQTLFKTLNEVNSIVNINVSPTVTSNDHNVSSTTPLESKTILDMIKETLILPHTEANGLPYTTRSYFTESILSMNKVNTPTEPTINQDRNTTETYYLGSEFNNHNIDWKINNTADKHQSKTFHQISMTENTTNLQSVSVVETPFIENMWSTDKIDAVSTEATFDQSVQENKENSSQITIKESPDKIAPLLEIVTDSTYEPITKSLSPVNATEPVAFNSSRLLGTFNAIIHDINIDNNTIKEDNQNNNSNLFTESNIVTISNVTTVNNTIKQVHQVTLNETGIAINLNNAQSKTNTTTTMFSEIPSTTQYKKGNELIGTSETYITDNIAVSNKENIMSNKATFDEIPYNMTNINFINKELSQNDTNTHSRSYENSELKLSPFLMTSAEVMINATEQTLSKTLNEMKSIVNNNDSSTVTSNEQIVYSTIESITSLDMTEKTLILPHTEANGLPYTTESYFTESILSMNKVETPTEPTINQDRNTTETYYLGSEFNNHNIDWKINNTADKHQSKTFHQISMTENTTNLQSVSVVETPFIENMWSTDKIDAVSTEATFDQSVQENKENSSQITIKESPDKIAPLLEIVTDSTYEPTTKSLSPVNATETVAFNSSRLLGTFNATFHDINIDNNTIKDDNQNNNSNLFTESNIVTISNVTTVNNTIKQVHQVTLNETGIAISLNNAQSKTNTTTTMFSEIPSTTQYKKGNELIGMSETYITDNIAVSNKENIMSNKATFDEIPYNMSNINFINKELSQNDTNTHSRSYENSELKLSPFTSEVMINTTEQTLFKTLNEMNSIVNINVSPTVTSNDQNVSSTTPLESKTILDMIKETLILPHTEANGLPYTTGSYFTESVLSMNKVDTPTEPTVNQDRKSTETYYLGSDFNNHNSDWKINNTADKHLEKTFHHISMTENTTNLQSVSVVETPFIENVSSTDKIYTVSTEATFYQSIQENKENSSLITIRENQEKIVTLLDIITDSTYEPTTKTISPINTTENASFNSSSLLRTLNKTIHDINIDNNTTKEENQNNNINLYTESYILTSSYETTDNNNIKQVPQVTLNETKIAFNLNNAESRTNTTTTMFSEIPSTTQYKKGNEFLRMSQNYLTDNIAVSNKDDILPSNKALFDKIPYNISNTNFIKKEINQNNTNMHRRSYENSELKLSPFSSTEQTPLMTLNQMSSIISNKDLSTVSSNEQNVSSTTPLESITMLNMTKKTLISPHTELNELPSTKEIYLTESILSINKVDTTTEQTVNQDRMSMESYYLGSDFNNHNNKGKINNTADKDQLKSFHQISMTENSTNLQYVTVVDTEYTRTTEAYITKNTSTTKEIYAIPTEASSIINAQANIISVKIPLNQAHSNDQYSEINTKPKERSSAIETINSIVAIENSTESDLERLATDAVTNVSSTDNSLVTKEVFQLPTEILLKQDSNKGQFKYKSNNNYISEGIINETTVNKDTIEPVLVLTTETPIMSTVSTHGGNVENKNLKEFNQSEYNKLPYETHQSLEPTTTFKTILNNTQQEVLKILENTDTLVNKTNKIINNTLPVNAIVTTTETSAVQEASGNIHLVTDNIYKMDNANSNSENQLLIQTLPEPKDTFDNEATLTSIIMTKTNKINYEQSSRSTNSTDDDTIGNIFISAYRTEKFILNDSAILQVPSTNYVSTKYTFKTGAVHQDIYNPLLEAKDDKNAMNITAPQITLSPAPTTVRTISVDTSTVEIFKEYEENTTEKNPMVTSISDKNKNNTSPLLKIANHTQIPNTLEDKTQNYFTTDISVHDVTSTDQVTRSSINVTSSYINMAIPLTSYDRNKTLPLNTLPPENTTETIPHQNDWSKMTVTPNTYQPIYLSNLSLNINASTTIASDVTKETVFSDDKISSKLLASVVTPNVQRHLYKNKTSIPVDRNTNFTFNKSLIQEVKEHSNYLNNNDTLGTEINSVNQVSSLITPKGVSKDLISLSSISLAETNIQVQSVIGSSIPRTMNSDDKFALSNIEGRGIMTPMPMKSITEETDVAKQKFKVDNNDATAQNISSTATIVGDTLNTKMTLIEVATAKDNIIILPTHINNNLLVETTPLLHKANASKLVTVHQGLNEISHDIITSSIAPDSAVNSLFNSSNINSSIALNMSYLDTYTTDVSTGNEANSSDLVNLKSNESIKVDTSSQLLRKSNINGTRIVNLTRNTISDTNKIISNVSNISKVESGAETFINGMVANKIIQQPNNISRNNIITDSLTIKNINDSVNKNLSIIIAIAELHNKIREGGQINITNEVPVTEIDAFQVNKQIAPRSLSSSGVISKANDSKMSMHSLQSHIPLPDTFTAPKGTTNISKPMFNVTIEVSPSTALQSDKYLHTNKSLPTDIVENSTVGLKMPDKIQSKPTTIIQSNAPYKSANDTKDINAAYSQSIRKQQIRTVNNKTESNINRKPPNNVNSILKSKVNTINLTNKYFSKIVNNDIQFSCWNRSRGKYADNKDCRKFYICIGRPQPIAGTCPLNSVFSDINKQCTRNLSHCVRNNQFQCLLEGRFSDFLRDNVYYICVKKSTNQFVRFKLFCQNGFHLNKQTIRCDRDVDVSSISSSSANEKVNSESEQKNKRNDSNEDFECDEEGKFPYTGDCRKYYVCSKSNKSDYRRKIKTCSSDKVFNKRTKKCVDSESYEC